MEVVVGTYEQLLLGYSIDLKDETQYPQFIKSFMSHAQYGPIHCLSVISNVNEQTGKPNTIVASGSTDETIQLYDFILRKESYNFSRQSGSLTCMCSHADGFMFSGADDGGISIWNTKTWKLVAELNVHKGRVNSFAVHPSGKLGLSVGAADRTLRTWDLTTATNVITTNLKQAGDIVVFSQCGKYYLLAQGRKLTTFEIKSGKSVCEFSAAANIISLEFLADDLLAIGCQCPKLSILNFHTGKVVSEVDAHEKRVKAIRFAGYFSEKKDNAMLVTGSSDGHIKVWKYNFETAKIQMLGSEDTGCRVTCLAVVPGSAGPDETSEHPPEMPVGNSLIMTDADAVPCKKKKEAAVPCKKKKEAAVPCKMKKEAKASELMETGNRNRRIKQEPNKGSEKLVDRVKSKLTPTRNSPTDGVSSSRKANDGKYRVAPATGAKSKKTAKSLRRGRAASEGSSPKKTTKIKQRQSSGIQESRKNNKSNNSKRV